MGSSSFRLGDLPEAEKLDRRLLADRAAEMLRDYISTGRIPEGARLKELEVSRLLGTSRMPAREALIVLEAEGLVESRSDGRYVVVLSEKDVLDLHEVRWTLEKAAVELAAANVNEEHRLALRQRYRELETAIANGDPVECVRCDQAIHREIWKQADNSYLLKLLDSIQGLIFVLAARVEIYHRSDTTRLLSQHKDLVEWICAGEGEKAAQGIEGHLREALSVSVQTFDRHDQ